MINRCARVTWCNAIQQGEGVKCVDNLKNNAEFFFDTKKIDHSSYPIANNITIDI